MAFEKSQARLKAQELATRAGAQVQAFASRVGPRARAHASRVGTSARAHASRVGSKISLAGVVHVSPVLLLHVSLLLAVVGGAGLATAARLKWDPSTYIAVRLLFPAEYRVAAVMLCVGSSVLVALGHLAVLTLCLKSPRTRRALLFMHATAMVALVCAELAWAAWTASRLLAWVRAHPDLLHGLQELRKYFMWALHFFNFMVPENVKDLLKEVEEDVPQNLYAGAAGVVLVGVLQPAAVLLALLSAAGARRSIKLNCQSNTNSSAGTDVPTVPKQDSISSVSTAHEKTRTPAPLRFVFKDGKLVTV